MSKHKKNKNKKYQKDDSVFYMSSEEATLAQMPKYNGFAGGYGIQGKTKYSRNDEKQKFRKFLDEND